MIATRDQKKLCEENGHRFGNVTTSNGNRTICRCCGQEKDGDSSLQSLPTGFKRTGNKYG